MADPALPAWYTAAPGTVVVAVRDPAPSDSSDGAAATGGGRDGWCGLYELDTVGRPVEATAAGCCTSWLMPLSDKLDRAVAVRSGRLVEALRSGNVLLAVRLGYVPATLGCTVEAPAGGRAPAVCCSVDGRDSESLGGGKCTHLRAGAAPAAATLVPSLVDAV